MATATIGYWRLPLEKSRQQAKLKTMTRSQIESAMDRNQPFSLRMADGKEYAVPHRDYIFLPPQGFYVVVVDDQEHVNVLPLLTMTGLSYKMSKAGTEG